MKKIFDGKCKDCEFGGLVEDQTPNYICCQLGGIREPDQTCNLLDKPAKPEDVTDYKAIVKEIEEYMHKEEYRLRTEGYAMVRGASRGKNFLKKLKAKHTPSAKKKPCTAGTQNPAPDIKYRVTDAYDSINEFKNDTEASAFIDQDGGLHPGNYPFSVERVEKMWEVVKAKHTPVSRETDVREKPEGKE